MIIKEGLFGVCIGGNQQVRGGGRERVQEVNIREIHCMYENSTAKPPKTVKKERGRGRKLGRVI
jgi:hypothetical protein